MHAHAPRCRHRHAQRSMACMHVQVCTTAHSLVEPTSPSTCTRRMRRARGAIIAVDAVCTAIRYTGLEELHKRYKSQGFHVLAFPCNQFGSQEVRADHELFV